MRNKLTVVTVVGTRPEIIRLSATIRLLDEYTNHILVHTGQNYDYELNEVFFEELQLRKPDYFLNADTSTLGSALGSIITGTESVLLDVKPDAFLVLGDTNSSISAVIARRLKIPVFHMEAGNRSFDENVPEETNRRMIDHIADYNLVYTEHSRRNLLAEGIHPSRIVLTGSPMREVLQENAERIASSDILEVQGLTPHQYMLVSLHREENVDSLVRLSGLMEALQLLKSNYRFPILISTHPRTKKRLDKIDNKLKDGLIFHPPFGFHDYVKLQLKSALVLSDSGTISEESSILGFRALTLRDFIERPESIDTGAIIAAGVTKDSILDAVNIVYAGPKPVALSQAPFEYQINDTSQRVLSFIRSASHSHYQRTGIRR